MAKKAFALRTLLVPHDFSDDGDAALDAALELAGKFGARVDLLHVYHRPVEMLSPYGVAVPPSVESDIRDRARERLAIEREKVEKAGLSGENHVREGEPAHEIADLASDIGADLIVMGTRGLTGLKHVVLGSVAERTVRIAHTPVLTVKPKERS